MYKDCSCTSKQFVYKAGTSQIERLSIALAHSISVYKISSVKRCILAVHSTQFSRGHPNCRVHFHLTCLEMLKGGFSCLHLHFPTLFLLQNRDDTLSRSRCAQTATPAFRAVAPSAWVQWVRPNPSILSEWFLNPSILDKSQ